MADCLIRKATCEDIEALRELFLYVLQKIMEKSIKLISYEHRCFRETLTGCVSMSVTDFVK